jgi:hypothetical protein
LQLIDISGAVYWLWYLASWTYAQHCTSKEQGALSGVNIQYTGMSVYLDITQQLHRFLYFFLCGLATCFYKDVQGLMVSFIWYGKCYCTTKLDILSKLKSVFAKVILLNWRENSHWKLWPTSTHIWYQCNKICNTLKLTFHGFWNNILKSYMCSMDYFFKPSVWSFPTDKNCT